MSIGSPNTLNIRPSVFSPTGTVIGAPVATASIPRTRPSVGPMAIHFTVSSPKCWETSTVNFPPSLVAIVMASLISGSLPSLNLISNTAPMIWVILPTFFSAIFYLLLLFFYDIASAPAIISVSSCVIELCLARLYFSDRSSIISSAFFVAESIACILAPFSLAIASTNAP